MENNFSTYNESTPILEIEKVVLAILMNSPKLAQIELNLIHKDFFNFEDHKIIFEAMKNLNENKKEIDPLIISDHLKNRQELEKVGGIVYLSNISGYFFTSEGFESYKEILIKNFKSKKIMEIADELIKKNNLEELDKNLVISSVVDKMNSLLISNENLNMANFEDLVQEIIRQYESEISLLGIPTMFEDLDDCIGGLKKGNLIIIGARPSMGKTTFALNLANNVSENCEGNILIYSLEMTSEEMARKLLSMMTNIELERIQKKGIPLSKREIELMTSVGQKFLEKKEKIKFNVLTSLTIETICSQIRIEAEKKKLSAVFIDYLQLIEIKEKSSRNRQYEVANISRLLKSLAIELSIPIVCLAQLNRDLEKREDKRPILADLRDSGAIEQDADIVLFLHREGYYSKEGASNNISQEEIEIIVKKNRNGKLGTTFARFFKNSGKFIHEKKNKLFD